MCRARSAGRKTDPDLTGEFGVGHRHEGGHLLMTDLDELDLAGSLQCADHAVDAVAGVSVDPPNSPGVQAFNDEIADFHVVLQLLQRGATAVCNNYLQLTGFPPVLLPRADEETQSAFDGTRRAQTCFPILKCASGTGARAERARWTRELPMMEGGNPRYWTGLFASAGHGSIISRTFRSIFLAMLWWCSRACPVRANPHWRSGRCMRKLSAAILNPSLHMPAVSFTRWQCLRWML